MSEVVKPEFADNGGADDGPQPKSKRTWGPNEAPLGRWVLFFVLALVIGFGVQIPFGVIMPFWKTSGDWYWFSGMLLTLLAFSCSFLVTAWLCRKVLRTSLRELILGAGGKADRGQCVRLGLAWIAGFLLTLGLDFILDGGTEVELNPVGAVPVFVNFVMCLALLWMQTTWEEIVYRCAFLRATCGNNIRPTVKCIVWGALGTAFFMSGHFFNPEVTAQTAAGELVMACLSYFVAGMGMYVSDAVYGSCMPGCVIHWVNNFVLFTVWAQAGTAGESAGVFFVRANTSGGSSLLGTVVLYLPIVALLIYDWRKGRCPGLRAIRD